MKPLFFLCIISLFGQQAQAQTMERQWPFRPIAVGTVPPVEVSDDVQRLFIKQQWTPGVVVLQNNSMPRPLPLLFDVYSNQLYYQQGGVAMEFLDPVRQFSMRLLHKNDSVDLLFRRGYPPVQKNTETTFYEVLADGAYQLLRCRAKTIYLHKENIPEEDRTYNKELLYAYAPGGKLVPIKKDAESLKKALPEKAAAIEQLVATHRLRLKQEADLVRLFELLNKES